MDDQQHNEINELLKEVREKIGRIFKEDRIGLAIQVFMPKGEGLTSQTFSNLSKKVLAPALAEVARTMEESESNIFDLKIPFGKQMGNA